MKSILRSCFVGLVALAIPALSPISASAATFTVDSIGDGSDSNTADGVCNDGMGNCTLRAAIQQANPTAVEDTILFNIPTNTISPLSALPNIANPLIIDGFSDPDSSRVEISGVSAGLGVDGLTITGEGVTIKGLVIRNFTNDGIDIAPAASQNNVEGNFIGTDVLGTGDQGNGGNGVDVRGAANTIGGPGLGNVISGNAQSGVSLTSSSSTANVVEGNLIGTDASGTAALGNDNHGVVITSSANNNTVGGSTAAERNVISGNGLLPSNGDGVRIQGGASANRVQGNFIGTDANGTSDVPNTLDGVGLRGSAFENVVGGTATGTGNVISGNLDDGIQVGTVGDTTTTRNGLFGNSISGNGNSTAPHNELGIDLFGVNGVDANDSGDGDSGGNNLQNFPELTSAASSATTTTISGTLNSQPSTVYRLEFFSNTACDTSGNGEGQTFLGATSVTTDSSGNVNFTATSLAGGAAGRAATATATDPATNTSEFSACRTVVFDPTPPVTGPPAPPPPPPAPPPPPVRCPGFQSDSRAQFVGSAGNDVLEGTSGRDIICGLGGNDTIRGLGRGDVLIGGPGADILIGGRGNDIVRGGGGRDIVRGGRGRDIVRGGRGRDTLLGGRSADTLLGGRGNDVLRGGPGPGRDVLDGGRGRDRCRGGRGNDVLRRCER